MGHIDKNKTEVDLSPARVNSIQETSLKGEFPGSLESPGLYVLVESQESALFQDLQ